jgi:hypothetical protein
MPIPVRKLYIFSMDVIVTLTEVCEYIYTSVVTLTEGIGI